MERYTGVGDGLAQMMFRSRDADEDIELAMGIKGGQRDTEGRGTELFSDFGARELSSAIQHQSAAWCLCDRGTSQPVKCGLGLVGMATTHPGESTKRQNAMKPKANSTVGLAKGLVLLAGEEARSS